MSQFKAISDHRRAAERFYEDVRSNAVRFYDIPGFSEDVTPSVYPVSYLEKCTHVVVAVSAAAVEGREWMIVCPYRVDRDRRKSQMVFDIDPLIMTFDADSLEPSPVAVIGYHLNFEGRTSPISGCTFPDLHTTVSQLRVAVTVGHTALDSTPFEVQAALNHMASYFRYQRYV
jgi:hypothetical protein